MVPYRRRSGRAGRSPHGPESRENCSQSLFRSYWIQRNITDMGQYSAAISDLTRSGREYREERMLLRKMLLTRLRPEWVPQPWPILFV